MCSGPRGERSLRASAARAAGTVQSPRPHDARPRGGRPEAKISRREVRGGVQGRRKEPRRARAGLTHIVVFLQRGPCLRPPGPAWGRVPRASPGSTQLSAGRPTALTFLWPPCPLQPRTDAYALTVLLPPLGSLLLTHLSA